MELLGDLWDSGEQIILLKIEIPHCIPLKKKKKNNNNQSINKAIVKDAKCFLIIGAFKCFKKAKCPHNCYAVCSGDLKCGKNTASETRNIKECNSVSLQDLQIDSPPPG